MVCFVIYLQAFYRCEANFLNFVCLRIKLIISLLCQHSNVSFVY